MAGEVGNNRSRVLDAIGVGSRVVVLVGSAKGGLQGRVTAIEGRWLYVRLEGERWKYSAPIPVERKEAELVTESNT